MQLTVGSEPQAVTLPADSPRVCSLSPEAAESMGVTAGQQVRIVPSDGGSAGAFTVTRVGSQPHGVCLGADGRELLSDRDTFDAHVFSTVPRTDLSHGEARRRGTVTETTWHDPTERRPVAMCAPHAGNMERNTARAATIAARTLGVDRCSAWLVEHFQPDPFDNWHVTSTRMHPGSYPGLERLATTQFQRAVSFHLYDGRDQPVIVGGRADDEVRAELAARIETAIDGRRSVVSEDGELMGDTRDNFVNWLTQDGDSGIQIETPPLVLKEKSVQLGRAVAEFIADTDL